MKARREALERIDKRGDTHAGLWMDKFLKDQTTGEGQDGDDAKGAKSELLDQASSIKLPEMYQAAFQRRSRTLPAVRSANWQVIVADARALGRAVIGLGQKGPTEIGICLEHTWGVPILAGSSLKGVAAAAAHQLHGGADWEKPGKPRAPNSYDWLFGTNDEKGAVSFLDAWLDPASAIDGRALHLDVMTVHHQAYYSGQVSKSTQDVYPPSDMDSPVPVSFLSTSGTFRVVLEGEPAWAEVAFTLLQEGLEHLGIGAKTNAGYGRFLLERERTIEDYHRQREAAKERQLQEELAQRWAGLDSLVPSFKGASNATETFKALLSAAKQGCPPARLIEIARRLSGDKEKKRVWKDWSKKDKRTAEEREYFEKLFNPPAG